MLLGLSTEKSRFIISLQGKKMVVERDRDRQDQVHSFPF